MRFALGHSEGSAVGRVLLAALAVALTAFVIVAPNHAAAEVGGFCGNVLLAGGETHCEGPAVGLYEIGGWGDQHSVCVRGRELGYVTCSTGAGAITYDPLPFKTTDNPQIWNHAAGSNRVHGFYYY
jgi:hypothetical protein